MADPFNDDINPFPIVRNPARNLPAGFFIALPLADSVPTGTHTMPLPTRTPPPPSRTLILAAFAAVYLIWGSTYLAIRISIETMPPFLMAGLRFVIAGGLLYGFLRWNGVAAPTRRQWGTSTMLGFLLLTAGNSVIVWAEQRVSSSVAALIVCTQPVWFALSDWIRPGGRRPRAITGLGIAIGLAGVVWLVAGATGVHSGDGRDTPQLLAVLGACVCWSAGSVFGRKWDKPTSSLLGAAMQMLCGGTTSLVVAAIRGEGSDWNWGALSQRSVLAFGYLVVFGSWIAYSAYVYLLQVTTPARVSTYAYVNPVIAVLLGSLVLHESVTGRMLIAGAVTIGGIVLLTLPDRRPRDA